MQTSRTINITPWEAQGKDHCFSGVFLIRCDKVIRISQEKTVEKVIPIDADEMKLLWLTEIASVESSL